MDIKSICIDISEKYNINSMGLFGSRARGDFYEESDYDIFIISNMTLDEELKLEYELEKEIGKEVDLVRLNRNIDRLFLRDILNEGVIFFDDGSYEELYRFVENFFIENSDFLKLRERDLIG